MSDNQFKYSNSVIALPLFFVWFLWFVYWLQIKFDFDFDENGILPRTFSGLQGVVFSPFIHADINHLYNNSIPLLILLAALRFFLCQTVFCRYWLRNFVFWIYYLDNWKRQLPHWCQWINLCIGQFYFFQGNSNQVLSIGGLVPGGGHGLRGFGLVCFSKGGRQHLMGRTFGWIDYRFCTFAILQNARI